MYRGLYPGISSPLYPSVLPRTGEVRPGPFHGGKQTQTSEVQIYISFGKGPGMCIGNIKYFHIQL